MHFADPCARVWPNSLLLPLISTYMLFEYGQDTALLLLCAERLYCIQRLQHYELSSRPALVRALLLFIVSAIRQCHASNESSSPSPIIADHCRRHSVYLFVRPWRRLVGHLQKLDN